MSSYKKVILAIIGYIASLLYIDGYMRELFINIGESGTLTSPPMLLTYLLILYLIVSVVMSLIKKNRPNFFITFLSGLFLFIINTRIVELISLTDHYGTALALSNIFFIALLIGLLIVQTIFYDKVGFLYIKLIVKLLAKLIGKIFDIKIVAESTIAKQDEIKPKSGPSLFLSNIYTSIENFFKRNRKIFTIVGLSIFGLFIISACTTVIVKEVTNNIMTKVVEVSPKSPAAKRTAIRVLYDGEVSLKDPQSDFITITPNITGVARIEGQSIIFVPDNELSLATKYSVNIDGSKLKGDNKNLVESKSFSFTTEEIFVQDTNFYYDVDSETNKINALIGEITFNLPIDIRSLENRIEISNQGKKLKYSLATSERPNLIYLTIKDIIPGEDSSNIVINIKKGILPVGGTIGMTKDAVATIFLKEKDRLSIDGVESYPVKGATYVAINFSLPVDESDVKQYVTIEPKVDFKLSSEYRYVLLEGNFRINTDYKIKVSKNIKSKSGLTMKYDYETTVKITDLEPYAKFASGGTLLPKNDNLNIEFTTLNLDKVNFTVEKIYKNNLVNYLRNDSYQNRKHMYSKTLEITEGELNEEVNNLINLKSLYNSQYEGTYLLTVADPSEYYNYSKKFVNITDIGLILKRSGSDLYLYSINISTLQPMGGVSLSLISSENQLLQSGTTDSSGLYIFKNYKNTLENLNPYIIIAEKSKDFTYLEIYSSEIDYSSFGIYGTSFNRDEFDGFITTERGIYRPGEDIYTSVILRKGDISTPSAPMPGTIELYNPNWDKIYEENVLVDDMGSFKIPTKREYKTGSYSVMFKLKGNNYFSLSSQIKIEEFVPNTIEVTTKLLDKVDKTVKFKISAKELHGAAAKGLTANGYLAYKSRRFESKKYPNYTFYDEKRREFHRTTESLETVELDDNGEYIYEFEIPDFSPPSALDLEVYGDVHDTSGRVVSDSFKLPIDVYDTYYGVEVVGKKPLSINREITVNYVALSPKDEETAGKVVNLRIERKVWYSIFKKYGWTNRYSSESYNEVIINKTITIDKKGSYNFTPDKGGEYTITLGETDGMITTKTINIYSSTYESGTDLTDPDKLKITLDKEEYKVGDTVYANISAPFSGRCMVSIEREKIYRTTFIDLIDGKANIPIEVSAEYSPNIYITAVAYRTPKYEQKDLPQISYGVANIKVSSNNFQKIKITTNEKAKASEPIKVDISIENGANSKLVVAMVDEGILAITKFFTPDPYSHFYRKRSLDVRTLTNIKNFLPNIAAYKKAYGGGGGEDEYSLEKRHLNPIEANRFKNLSLVSPVLTADANGNVSYTFDIKQEFNGKVRIMVFSANGNKFGCAATNVTISDPIVVAPGIPRILAPNDIAYIPIRVFNKTGKDGNFDISLGLDGPLELAEGKEKATLTIKDGDEGKLTYKIRAKNGVGVAHIIFSAAGNGETTKSSTEIAVRPVTTSHINVINGEIKAGEEAKISIPDEYIKEGRFDRLAISASKLTLFLGGLDYLIQYPYGCSEQLTSKTFPMLYLGEYLPYTTAFSGKKVEIDKYVHITIEKLSNRQTSDGGFSLWDGGDYSYDWLSDYVSHFLIEAKKAGYPVSNAVYDKILKRLGLSEEEKGRLDRREQYNYSEANEPYKLYLKALVGKPDFDGMKFFYDKVVDKVSRDEIGEVNRCFVSLAYSLSGDVDKAKVVLPTNFEISTAIRKYSGNFDSYIRNTALYIYASSFMVSTFNTSDIIYNKMVRLENTLLKYISSSGNIGNIQDTAWVLIALSNMDKQRNNSINVSVKSETIDQTFTERGIIKNQFGKGEVTIKNSGNDPTYYNFLMSGYPLNLDKNGAENGFRISREYRNVDGTTADIKSIKRGDKVVVTLNITKTTKEKLENIIIVDLLPSGFEIENSRIESRGDFGNIPKNYIDLEYQDIRDDRMLLFVRNCYDTIRYSYVVNATTAGEFVVPQFLVEAMYNPEINARTKGGEILKIVDGK